MEKHFRRFANGRALGGHMRSHLAAAAKTYEPSPSASYEEDEEFEAGYGLRENPKRSCRVADPDFFEPESSVSDASPEEDVAISLMMLSRDTWKMETTTTRKSKHQCKTCKRVFRSYQALGGHRASHKKFNTCFQAVRIREPDLPDGDAEEADHACPICSRVFSSGQALGGHKRSHLVQQHSNGFIDLNLPAPAEEEADQLSAVSDELNWA